MPEAITLFTPYFAARTPERQRELDLCLQRNLACAELQRLVLLVDDGHRPPVADPRITVLDVASRPTYADWVRLSREHAEHGISLLANSDIHFDASLSRVRECLATPRRFLALSRYELTGDELVPHPRPEWSQDVWGLRADDELHPGLMKLLDIPLGVPRCDNKVAYLFAVYGWQLSNPQTLLRSVHVHETQQRNYDKTADLSVLGAVAYVHPTTTPTEVARVDIDVWAVNAQAIGSVRLNRSLDNWAAARARGQVPVLVETAPADTAPRPATAGRLTPTPATAGRTTPTPVARGTPAALPPPVLTEEAPASADWPRFVTAGRRVYAAMQRFEILEHRGQWLVLDWLQPDLARTLPQGDDLGCDAAGVPSPEKLLALFVPAVLPTEPVQIAERPRSASDLHFWQYPAATEKQARDNHLRLPPGSHVDVAGRTVHTYLGLPWATYIDKKAFPEELRQVLPARLAGLSELARSFGWRLAVHTVCQQIHWRRLIDTFIEFHVTDLHLSHATTDIDPAREGWPLRVHSWPLIAPNIEDPSRRAGLVIGKPPGQRKYLASFIGAHMPHYRSDARVKLAEAAQAAGRPDVLVEVGGLWHFNHVVYKEQVAGKALELTEQQAHDAATRRYNEVLSDSVFSLCPEGAGPNTLRVWESLAVGAIPVIVAEGWVAPAPVGGQPDLQTSCLFLPRQSIPDMFSLLAAVPKELRESMTNEGQRAYTLLRSRACFGMQS
jgi:hypothetical protein